MRRFYGIVCVIFRTRLMKDASYFSSYKWPYYYHHYHYHHHHHPYHNLHNYLYILPKMMCAVFQTH